MTRSKFAIGRLIVLPYSVLLTLQLLVIGGGGAGLYFQVRAVETRLLVNEVKAAIEPLVEKLEAVDAIASMRDALLNVIINAVQSGQHEGAVRVAAYAVRVAAYAVRVAAYMEYDGVLQIAVEDNGKGIPPKNFFTIADARRYSCGSTVLNRPENLRAFHQFVACLKKKISQLG